MDHRVELKHVGNRALASRDYDRAKRAFHRLLEMDPSSVEGHLGLAKAFERTNDHEAIVALLEPASERVGAPSILKALAEAYRVLANRGELLPDRAIAAYEAYHRQRKDPVTLFYLGELYREHKRDYKRALASFRESWALDPGSPTVYRAAIDCARRLGGNEEAAALQEEWSGQVRR